MRTGIDEGDAPDDLGTSGLLALIPPVVADVILAQPLPITADFAKAVPAVVLCADLAGFSVAGAALARSQARGAEELQGMVNAIFGRVTEAIQSRGGTILQFSGDGVTAAWPSLGGTGDETARAIAAGLALQDDCRRLSVTAMSDIHMRVSLTKGDVWVAHLASGSDAPETVLCGKVFDAFGTADPLQDGVTLDRSLWDQMSAAFAAKAQVIAETNKVRVRALQWEPPARGTPPPLSTPDAARLKTYVPAYLRALLAGVGSDWLAEFRSAQILFARFPGFDFRGPQDLPALARLAALLRQAVEGNGGVRLKFGTDDKGLILLAGWGLQSRTYEDNAARALTAAAMIQGAAAALGVAVSIGVTGGKVFAGLVGSDGHREYTVIGDPVNRAAALSAGPSGQTRVDDQTRSAGATRFGFADAGPLTLKGQDPAPQYILTSETRGLQDNASLMVGRSTERGQIDAFVASLGTGTAPGVVQIIGDAGLGKSRLAGYLYDQLTKAGIAPLRLNADNLRRTTGFHPWRQLVGQVLGAQGDAKAIALCRDMGPGVADLIPLLAPVLSTLIPDTALTAGLFGGGRAEKTLEVILALLTGLIDTRPGVMIVEDAHWLDSASWQLLERFSRSFPLVPVVLVCRPMDHDALPFEARRLLDQPGLIQVQLGPMSRADSTALINAALAVVETAPAIIDLIYTHAEGHPLFTSAFAQSLRDQGLLRIDAGYAHLRMGEQGLSHIGFPDGVEGVVAERIAGLTPAEQLTLKVAAVLGRGFDLDTLTRIHPAGVDPMAVRHDLDAAIRANLIEAVDATSGQFRFHHAIIGDAAYRLLVSDQRRALHAKTADLLDGKGAALGYPAASLALLAHHFEQAEVQDKAVDFLSRAAEQARAGYNNAEVIEFLTRALRIVDKQPGLADRVLRGTWHHRIADALKALGHYQRAAEFLFESASLLDRPPPRSTRGALIKALTNYARYRLQPHRAPRPALQRDPMIAAAEINMTLSEIHYELNKVPFSLAEVLRAVTLARNGGGDSTTLAKIYMGMALISRALPKALDGNDLQAKSLDIAERLADLPTLSWVYMASGVFEMGKCGWTTGEAHFHRSMRTAETCGERKNWETSMSSLGNLKRVEGWFEQAKACSDATLAAARDRDVSHSIAWSHNGRLRDLLVLNRFDEAAEDCRILNVILTDPKKKGDTNDNSNVVDGYARALLAIADGNLVQARAGLDDATAVIRAMTKPQVYMVQNVSFICDVVWNLWRRTSDHSLLTHSAVVAKHGGRMAKQYRAGTPSATLAAGDHAWYRGDKAGATKHWLASAAAASDRGMRYNQAQALFRLEDAGCLPEDQPGPGWPDLLAHLGIARPVIWSMEPR